ncbi:MAG: dihydrodipicolinate synthase family protein [Chloroflexota bacterium]|nr:dihydrodipicolinate synthase family protein [Chloroflexota bacterium]
MPATDSFLRGVFVPLVTPFGPSGELDEGALEHLLEFLIEAGVHGLFVGGTTGEFPLLRPSERKRMAEVVTAGSAARVPVVVQSGAAATRDAIDLTRHARDIGATAAAVVAPYFFPLADDALIDHYVAVCSAVPEFPILLYNIPQRTGNALLPAIAAEIVRRCPNVVGIKDSSGNLSQTIQYRAAGAGFQVAQGADGLLVAGLAMGIQATVSGNANVFPELAVAVFEAWWRGDQEGARAAQERLDRVRHALRDGLDLSLFKRVLARRGYPVGDVRSPLPRASQAEVDEAVAAIQAASIPLEARSLVGHL